MDIFAELKKRADREIEGLRESSAKTDDANEKYKYRKIRVGIEAMINHVYEVENEFRVSKAYKNEVTTKADKIRSMSDEELAEFLVNFKNTFGKEYEGKMSCLEWLQSEAE